MQLKHYSLVHDSKGSERTVESEPKSIASLGIKQNQILLIPKLVMLFGLLGHTSVVLAQPEGPDQHNEAFAESKEEDHETAFDLSVGGSLNTGNTQSWTLSAGNRFYLLRGRHSFEQTTAFNYGQADIVEADGEEEVDALEDTVRNLNIRGRYDFFLAKMDALFTALLYRWDTFAGLDARVQGQFGYLRNIFKQDGQRGWAEAGYDITYDNLDPDPLPDPENEGAFLDGTDIVHSARLFVGYDNHINEHVTFLTGLETLFNVENADDIRVNWDAAIRAALMGSLQLELKFAAKFDTEPVPGAEKLDTNTLLNLIYTML